MDLMKFFELLNTTELLTFFKRQHFQILHLDDDDYAILCQNKLSGVSFLHSDKEDFKATGLSVFISVELNILRKKIKSIIEKSKTNSDDSEVKQFTSLVKVKEVIKIKSSPLKDILEENISPIVEQLLEFHHKDMVLKQFRNYNEAAFQVAVAKLFPSKNWVPEMRLVNTNGTNGKYAFVDLFINGKNENVCGGISNVVLELKHISLLGLYSGKEGKWKGDIDYKTMLNLDNTLKEESEFDLLERNYYYWCKDNKSYKATKIRKIVNSGIDQVQRYISLLNKASIDDCNVELISPGLGIIGGWLVVLIGSQRILTRKIEFKKIKHEFILRD